MTISTSAELEDLIDGTVSIPTIPTVLTEITDIFNSPDGSAKEAGEVIEKDAAIATRVLRLVNSPFYGLKNPVSNINLACSILGLRAIKSFGREDYVYDRFDDQLTDLYRTQLSRVSVSARFCWRFRKLFDDASCG